MPELTRALDPSSRSLTEVSQICETSHDDTCEWDQARMPETEIRFYCEGDGSAPVLDWLVELSESAPRAYQKCRTAIERLATFGYELRRPQADLLKDGIHVLRVRVGRANYRVLYFFHGRNVVVLAHGLTKEEKVPPADLKRALERKLSFEADPEAHTYEEDR